MLTRENFGGKKLRKMPYVKRDTLKVEEPKNLRDERFEQVQKNEQEQAMHRGWIQELVRFDKFDESQQEKEHRVRKEEDLQELRKDVQEERLVQE